MDFEFDINFNYLNIKGEENVRDVIDYFVILNSFKVL